MILSTCVLLLGLGYAAAADNVLVILDNPSILETHSIFLDQLTKTGFKTTIKLAEDSSLALKKYGEYLYQHLVLFSPSVEEFGGGLTAESVVEFIDDGGNVLIAAGANTGDLVRDIVTEVGIELDEDGTSVIDHLNFDAKDTGHHNLIHGDPSNLVKSERIVGKSKFPFLYRGLGMVADPANPLVLTILSGSSSAYSHNPEEVIKDYPHAVGKNTMLIGGMQARNNARVVVSGSLEFFSDEFFRSMAEKPGAAGVQSGNEGLSASLVSWCFKQTGVIRIDSLNHKRAGELRTPNFYTIRENCEFSLRVSELKNGEWVPFTADDMQMEFIRIDPFVRQKMISSGGLFTAKFRVPDVYGVFKFVVDYSRIGLTRISSSTQISIHPLQHNQYERFIYSAYPYYASAFSMMAGVFFFSFIFLHLKEETKNKSE